MDKNDERSLVRSARSGDLDAFERLYRLNVGRVYAVCLRMAGSAASAEELAQEAFVRAWRKLKDFRGDSGFGTWLTRIAVNVARNDLRNRGRREALVALTGEADALAAPAVQRDAETALDLERAVASLPAQARQVFTLHDIEGWKHREIAHETGLAVGTCKSHLRRARALLREALNV